MNPGEVAQSVLSKSDEVCALRRTVELTLGDRIGQAGVAMAGRIRRGLDELHDALLDGAVVPGRQGIALSPG